MDVAAVMPEIYMTPTILPPALMTMQGGNRQPMIIEEIHEKISMSKISEN